ncbi:RNA-dependent RNA polymerase [Cucumis melo cryptic virus]|nr:RNA-dependent RNA polymerase [Cucumis melo cryptic virus]
MLRDLTDYTFLEFSSEFETLSDTHPHIIRREAEQILKDEFALSELNQAWPLLYDQKLKGWARSFYTLEGHMQAIHAYSNPDTPISSLNQTTYRATIDSLKNELSSLPKAKAFDVLTELDKIPYEQSSAAGYNYIGPKGPLYGVNHKRAIRNALATLWSAIRDDDGGPAYVIRNMVPDVGYTRTQLTDLREKTKVRGVWGRAFHYILLEGTAARPLLETFIANDTFYHIGDDPQLSVPRLLSHVSSECRWLYAVDWSAFDATVSRFEIEAAFDVMRDLIIFPNFETRQAFELSRLLFTHKKIAAPDGRIYWIHKGIPSGSYYTSMVGSIINRLRIGYLWRTMFNREPKMCFTQGDDSLIGDDELVDPVTLAALASQLNWNINPNKTEHSRTPEFVSFLGRTSKGGFNSRELEKCLRLLIFPEHPVLTGRISAYRARSINEDSGFTSNYIQTIARRLRRRYGIAEESEVPRLLQRYIPQ